MCIFIYIIYANVYFYLHYIHECVLLFSAELINSTIQYNIQSKRVTRSILRPKKICTAYGLNKSSITLKLNLARQISVLTVIG